jgi:hypothetical protein
MQLLCEASIAFSISSSDAVTCFALSSTVAETESMPTFFAPASQSSGPGRAWSVDTFQPSGSARRGPFGCRSVPLFIIEFPGPGPKAVRRVLSSTIHRPICSGERESDSVTDFSTDTTSGGAGTIITPHSEAAAWAMKLCWNIYNILCESSELNARGIYSLSTRKPATHFAVCSEHVCCVSHFWLGPCKQREYCARRCLIVIFTFFTHLVILNNWLLERIHLHMQTPERLQVLKAVMLMSNSTAAILGTGRTDQVTRYLIEHRS